MHILIRVIVLAADMTEVVGAARFALDRLIWIGEGASTTFDYYKMLNERPPGIVTSLASESQTTIRQHLQRLVDGGTVEEVLLPDTADVTIYRTGSTGSASSADGSSKSTNFAVPRTRFESSPLALKKQPRSGDTRTLLAPSGE